MSIRPTEILVQCAECAAYDPDAVCPQCRWVPSTAATVGAQPVMTHIDSADCWCEPELVYTNPDNGASVYLHHKAGEQ